MAMERRSFLKWLTGGAVVLSTVQAETARVALDKLTPLPAGLPEPPPSMPMPGAGGGAKVINLRPAPDASDAATKEYVESISQHHGLTWRAPVGAVATLPEEASDGDARFVEEELSCFVYADELGWCKMVGIA